MIGAVLRHNDLVHGCGRNLLRIDIDSREVSSFYAAREGCRAVTDAGEL